MSTPERTGGSTARALIEKPTPAQVGTEGEESGASTWDVVDEASWESFPASDPPAYLRGKTEPDVKSPR